MLISRTTTPARRSIHIDEPGNRRLTASRPAGLWTAPEIS